MLRLQATCFELMLSFFIRGSRFPVLPRGPSDTGRRGDSSDKRKRRDRRVCDNSVSSLYGCGVCRFLSGPRLHPHRGDLQAEAAKAKGSTAQFDQAKEGRLP